MKLDMRQVDLVARDMEAALAFYRALGVEIPESAVWRTKSGIHHIDVVTPGGVTLHWDSPELAKSYDRGWREPSGPGTRVILTFHVESRDDVDRIHEKLAGLGHPCPQPPYDTFWGAIRPRAAERASELVSQCRTARLGGTGVTRQTTLPTSSATKIAPERSTATPTGRPRALPSSSRNPVSRSSGAPAGSPPRNGTKMTL